MNRQIALSSRMSMESLDSLDDHFFWTVFLSRTLPLPNRLVTTMRTMTASPIPITGLVSHQVRDILGLGGSYIVSTLRCIGTECNWTNITGPILMQK